ncbi:MAG TPA: hypothetical protein VJT75_13880, partial [Thermoleophilaceae bacterium]|nr:hypothetical protein [Thermoleophilaceae bacterium]
ARGLQAAPLPGLGDDDDGGGAASNPATDQPGEDRAPSPYVGPSPAGEGDPNPGGGGGDTSSDDGNLVGEVTTTACGAVSSVGASIDACGGSGPEAYEDPYAGAPVDAGPVDVQVEMPAMP